MPNSAPVVTPINKNIFLNAFVKASELFSVSDADGDQIQKYRFLDFNDASTSGKFELAGINQINGNVVTINANQLVDLNYLAGSVIGNEGIRIQAYDGEDWSPATSIAQAYTVRQQITRPVASIQTSSVLGNEYIQVDAIINAFDPDGYPIKRFAIRDRNVDRSFLRLGGQKLQQGVFHSIRAEEMSELRYFGFGNGREKLDVFAYDGTMQSNFATAFVTTRLNENRPVVQFNRFVAPVGQNVSISDKIVVSDADGSSIKRYRLIDTSPHAYTGFLTRDGVPLASKTWHTVNANDLDRIRYISADRTFSEQIRVQAWDGRLWSAVQSIVMDTVPRPTIGGPNNVVNSQLQDTLLVTDDRETSVLFQQDDGPAFRFYELVDTNPSADSGNLFFRNSRLNANEVHTYTVAQMIDNVAFRTGPFGDRQLDEVYARAWNGTYYSEWRRVNFRTESEDLTAMFTGADGVGQGGIDGPQFPGSGIPITISFSFMQQFPDYETGEAVDEPLNDPPRPFIPFTQDQKVATRRLFRDVESFLNVEFVEVADTSFQEDTGYRGGVIRLGNYTLEGPPPDGPSSAAAFAFLPATAPQAGDIWINSFFTPIFGAAWDYGGSAYTTLIHELGHAMGLDHPFVEPGGGNQKPVLPFQTDSDQFTAMSYTGSPNGISPWNHQLYDIINLQEIYGANESFAVGNNVYSVDSFGSQRPQWTIWDTAGTDEISAQGSLTDSVVDLRAGGFSSIGSSFNNVSIAFGVFIENATGSDNNDTLIGNELSNEIVGLDGNDTIRGLGGDDLLMAGAGNDNYVYGVADGNDIIDENRQAGIDRITITDFVGLDSIQQDLSFRRDGLDLLINLTIGGDESQGQVRINNQAYGAFRVESLTLAGQTIDLRELYDIVGPNDTQFRVTSETGAYGNLVVPV